MEIINADVPDSFDLYDLSDLHVGSPLCSIGALQEVIDEVAANPKARLICKGDAIECILPNDKRYVHTGIMDEYKDFKLDLWCFDTRTYNYAKFSGDTADEIMDYKVKGGGGTDFDVNWDFMKEQGIEPKRFIMFTDGYPCGSWGDENYCETLFVIHGTESIVSPFGQTAYYK